MDESELLEAVESEALPIGTVLQDRYRIVAKLGEGGMGVVYEAEHLLIKKRVAVKCLLPEFARDKKLIRRFLREARAATSVGHENIIDVVDFGRLDDGNVFMVTEYLEGRDLRSMITEEGALSVGRTAHILCQICGALAATHDKGVIHRDLKPGNIFIIARQSDPCFVKVLDFGLSKFIDLSEDSAEPVTRTGAVMGTPWYMAPEQLAGRDDLDHRIDIYAIGVILFNMLTGRRPFEHRSLPALVLSVCTEDAPSLSTVRSDVPRELQAICARLLAKRPEDRYASCHEVQRALLPFTDPELRRSYSLPPKGEGRGSDEGSGALPRPVPVEAMAETMVPGEKAAGSPEASTPSATSPTHDLREGRGELQGAAAAPERASEGSRPPRARSGRRNRLVLPGLVLAATVASVVWIGLDPAARDPAAQDPAGEDGAPSTTALEGASSSDPSPSPAAAIAADPEAPATPALDAASGAQPGLMPATETVRIRVATDPANAELFLDGDRIANPFDADLTRSESPRRLEARHRGYRTRVQDLVLRYPQRLTVTLRRGAGLDDRRAQAEPTPPPEARPASTGAPAPTSAPEPVAPPEAPAQAEPTGPEEPDQPRPFKRITL